MNIKRLNRFCPICGSNIGDKLGDVKMVLGKNVRLPRTYDIVSCENCGFTFADTEAEQEDYNAYYVSDNCYSYNGEIKSETMQQKVICTIDFFANMLEKMRRY